MLKLKIEERFKEDSKERRDIETFGVVRGVSYRVLVLAV